MVTATASKRRAQPPAPPPKVIRDPAFAKRFEQAADLHAHCPVKHRGRLGWVAEQMRLKGVPVSNETVRKWFDGEAKPRSDKGELLAEIMQVDAAWLMMGIDATIAPRERKVRNAMASGVVNLVAGLIQMDGGHPAFPEESDTRAHKEHVDIYAIVRGANYALHVVLGETHGRQAQFVVPTGLGENVIVIGVIRDGLAFDLFELTPEVIEKHGTGRGGSIEITVEGSKLRPINGFSQRL